MSDLAGGFVARHNLWDEQQREAAVEIQKAVRSLDFVRVVASDLHGLPRSKCFTRDAFLRVLRDGACFTSTLFVLDSCATITLDLLAEGAHTGVAELRGAGNFVVVPDPLTFRVLPYTSPPCGWVIGDEYLRSGGIHPLSSRRVLRGLCIELETRGWRHMVGLEIEWYLTRYLAQDIPGTIGGFGIQGDPPSVSPVNSGFWPYLDSLIDALAPVLDPLADALLRLGLPLRTIEHESGPGQIEFTFEPMDALEAADAVVLIRTATKQVCSRLGHHASFMALPGIAGFIPSGWHLHQSLALRRTPHNLFGSPEVGRLLSPLGRMFLGGLVRHAVDGTVFATPTVNGYRRFGDTFGTCPSRVGWSAEHRAALVRVVGGSDATETHLESRIGEPSANPYLYIGSQLSAGLDGIDRHLDPGEATRDPHNCSGAPLPDTLGAALAAFAASPHYLDLLGPALATHWTRLKSSELGRYEAWRSDRQEDGIGVSEWEHREYFPRF